MTSISAEMVLDSVSPEGIRLAALKLRHPRWIHAEFMTHRVLSRNASSSRAIPTAKLLEEVRSDELRATPIFWGKNQKGMQAREELETTSLYATKVQWREAALNAANCAEAMAAHGAHKQIVNRILEPFLHINVIVTATEWENFFHLRLHPDAQPEMQELARVMKEAMDNSVPVPLLPEEWHLPFVGQFGRGSIDLEVCRKVSVARCARVSYQSFETGKKSTLEEDLALYEKLASSGHWSPFEHQATPDYEVTPEARGTNWLRWKHPEQHGNFVGWKQFRKMFPNENRN